MHPVTETQNSVRLGEIIKEFHLELLHEGDGLPEYPAADPGRKPPRPSAVRLF